ncbi:helix-turn-helix domain-containing protein [Acaryochloris sp. IP29b_bin.137]|uniref:helix-turn-helix domain-containing protein n=1 Tax=Acaryochloris sp. IP29b_bin.137 TaxID=2969217 RepID=UPI00260A78CB|nr:helix-turn-helix domain-containing protein [Acaryochloris sp. IP29b_bin.137]
MTYTIKDSCNVCENCYPQCPIGAIKPEAESDGYWIDPTLCDGCQDIEIPHCVQVCSVGALSPLQAKKGRYKSTLLPAAIPDIFLNGKSTPFASSMVIWEACNILAMQQRLPWQTDLEGCLEYRRSVRRGLGEMRFRLAANPEDTSPAAMPVKQAMDALKCFDIRATCIHLIFAAYAMTVDCAWQDTFVLNDQHIEQYLGLDKRKDLTKLEKLTLIKKLVSQTCQILVAMDWPRQGKVQAFSIGEYPIWHLLDTQYYFEQDAHGYRHLIGLSFTVRAGRWAEYFLNKQNYRRQTVFYQYGTLPQSLLTEVMGHWQQHPGAIRLLLWLLFKLRLGGDHRLKVRTLLRIAYGDERLKEATSVRGAHKRLLKSFENSLEHIYYYGLKPIFDSETYPSEIQPLWARVSDIPDDVDEALEFWVEDANQSFSLTDAAPRDKWQRLLNARLLGFELPEIWQQTVSRRTNKKRSRSSKRQTSAQNRSGQLSGHAVKAARQAQRLSQRALADRLGKSQSWIRDIEKGRFSISPEDQAQLQKTLNISC